MTDALTIVYVGSQIILIIVMMFIVIRLLGLILYVRHPLPFVPTHRNAIKAIIQSGILTQREKIVDLGCGWGTLMAMARRHAPRAAVEGVELRSFLVRLARLRFLFDPMRPTITQGDLFNYSIAHADTIIGFWITDLMPALFQKFLRECSPGCRIVSVIFALPSDPAFEHQIIQGQGVVVHVYTKT
jgi:hypothetical protein